ncbi:MAG: acyltransferase [Rikenellaceae bacterium]
MEKEKNLSIETLRGFAILLVVIGHVIGSAPDGGMKIDYPSGWRYLYIWIDYIQMPLFTAIAGWIYALKPIGKPPFRGFVSNKIKRLLIPMATVGTLYFLIQYFTPGTNSKEAFSSIWEIYLFPYTMYWYLQSLFLIFVCVAIVDKLGLMKTFNRWCTLILVAYLLYILESVVIPYEIPNVFSFKGAINQLPYFLAGVGVYKFRRRLNNNPIIITFAAIGLILLQMTWFFPMLPNEAYRCLLPIWLVATLILLFEMRYTNKFLVYFGTYAYTIYLFHGFGTSGGRIILSYINIHSEIMVFMLSLLLGAFAPILIDKILDHSRYLRMLFLGKKRNPLK